VRARIADQLREVTKDLRVLHFIAFAQDDQVRDTGWADASKHAE